MVCDYCVKFIGVNFCDSDGKCKYQEDHGEISFEGEKVEIPYCDEQGTQDIIEILKNSFKVILLIGTEKVNRLEFFLTN